jgi:hypothetical protein
VYKDLVIIAMMVRVFTAEQEQVALALRRPRVLRQRTMPVAHVHWRGVVGL